jgi:hypothetical protein
MRTAYIIASAATVAALSAGLTTGRAAPSTSALPLPPVASSHTWMSIPPADPRGAGAMIMIRPVIGTQRRCVDTHAWRA